ncbi:hypothetical protein EMCRGX_G028829 [Ephydatia muelleri]
MISESCTTQSVVKVGTLGEASMMTGSNTITVSATLPAAVVYQTQAIESDAVANYEMQEAEQTSLLSFPENSAGISTQTLIETRCENKQNNDLHPAISSGDFGRSIVETVIFCGLQGIAFRGHQDNCPDVQDDPNGNHGNFLALLNFCIQAGDRVLEEHLKNSASNALYTSKTVQNELIVICGDIIRNKILAKARRAKYFSIIADEATDVANDEQLSICVRYVEEELDMRFDKETISIIVECIQLMPSEIVNSNTTISEPDYSNLLKLYGDDLPFSRGFDSEMDMWKIKWTKMPSEANELDTPEKVLRHTDKDFYPNIHALLVIITTLPVTSCECEI